MICSAIIDGCKDVEGQDVRAEPSPPIVLNHGRIYSYALFG